MEAMLRPVEFFRALNPTVPFSRPLIFFLLFSILGSAASTLSWMAAGPGFYDEVSKTEELPRMLSVSGSLGAFNFFISPFTALVGLAINTGLTHIGTLVFVPSRKRIGVTARVYCYSAAPTVMAIVPTLGWAMSFVWVLVLSVIGIQHAHGTSTGRALASVLVPPLVIVFGIVFLMFALGVMLVALGGAV
jgi:hypothetical protein